MDVSNTDKTWVITGAGSGLGRELLLQVAAAGDNVAAADIDRESLQAAAEQARRSGSGEIETYRLDVASEADINEFARRVLERFDTVDVVINNAGITRVGEFTHSCPDGFKTVMDINFWGVVHGSRAFLPALLQSRGSLVNISSVFGLIGVPRQSAYCASKFAVRGFTESLRQELYASGVHVAAVHPGGIRTAIARSAVFDQGADSKDETVARLEKDALKMPADKAAAIILKGIARRSPRILIGGDARLIAGVQRLFPKAYPRVLALLSSGLSRSSTR
ncbi:SDR family NAD(P)-dependent oxidoreductase [Exilibacterium tricleocarpae]|uniref:SDR family NAD(P)-dependent oxidoreductase n=1 Tax=Exilibacterium tricleocarpae TaxID=2591008 RepID=A0A545TVH7_9GAMM|nr:SDR family NAD(P)-dependent oxidoreductase [Exilibacterium tricleocarpae]TQV81214.1 SDR family NAD(P)-dependent oxidoreductase [Exilibacterium tricleocarpae]